MVYSRHNAKQNLLSALKYKDKESLKDIIASYIAKNVTLNREKVIAALNDAGIKASGTDSTTALIEKVVKNIGNKGLVNGIKVIGDTELSFTGQEKEATEALPKIAEADLADIKKRANEMTGNGTGGGNAKKFIFWTAVTLLGIYLISNIKWGEKKLEDGGAVTPDMPPLADPAIPTATPAPVAPPATPLPASAPDAPALK